MYNSKLTDEIKSLRERMNTKGTEFKERETELLRAITLSNRRNKRLKERLLRRDDAIRDLKRNKM